MDISALLALREGTTPWPWIIELNRPFFGWVDVVGPSIKVGSPTMATDLTDADYRIRMKDAHAIAAVPDLFAALEAQQAEIAALKEAFGMLEDALQEAGDDYPGSSMQQWCQQQVQAAHDKLGGQQ